MNLQSMSNVVCRLAPAHNTVPLGRVTADREDAGRRHGPWALGCAFAAGPSLVTLSMAPTLPTNDWRSWGLCKTAPRTDRP